MVVQVGVSGSHDVALWTEDAKLSFIGCVSYTTESVNDNLYLCANGINDGRYAFNNLPMYDDTWYHKFGSSWHMATEMYAMYQMDVPSVNGSIASEKGINGANCSVPRQTCLTPEWAMVKLHQQAAFSARFCFVS